MVAKRASCGSDSHLVNRVRPFVPFLGVRVLWGHVPPRGPFRTCLVTFRMLFDALSGNVGLACRFRASDVELVRSQSLDVCKPGFLGLFRAPNGSALEDAHRVD